MSLSWFGGVTTFFGGGSGPADGSNGTSVTSGTWNIEMMLRAVEGLPVNVGILAKGGAGEAALIEQVVAGAAGFKVHEDSGATLAAIRATNEATYVSLRSSWCSEKFVNGTFGKRNLRCATPRQVSCYQWCRSACGAGEQVTTERPIPRGF